MARGWESKSVESQVDSAAAARAARVDSRRKSPDEVERDSKIHGLLLSRTRVVNDLQNTTNPRYRTQLEAALAYLERQIAELERPKDT